MSRNLNEAFKEGENDQDKVEKEYEKITQDEDTYQDFYQRCQQYFSDLELPTWNPLGFGDQDKIQIKNILRCLKRCNLDNSHDAIQEEARQSKREAEIEAIKSNNDQLNAKIDQLKLPTWGWHTEATVGSPANDERKLVLKGLQTDIKSWLLRNYLGPRKQIVQLQEQLNKRIRGNNNNQYFDMDKLREAYATKGNDGKTLQNIFEQDKGIKEDNKFGWQTLLTLQYLKKVDGVQDTNPGGVETQPLGVVDQIATTRSEAITLLDAEAGENQDDLTEQQKTKQQELQTAKAVLDGLISEFATAQDAHLANTTDNGLKTVFDNAKKALEDDSNLEAIQEASGQLQTLINELDFINNITHFFDSRSEGLSGLQGSFDKLIGENGTINIVDATNKKAVSLNRIQFEEYFRNSFGDKDTYRLHKSANNGSYYLTRDRNTNLDDITSDSPDDPAFLVLSEIDQIQQDTQLDGTADDKLGLCTKVLDSLLDTTTITYNQITAEQLFGILKNYQDNGGDLNDLDPTVKGKATELFDNANEETQALYQNLYNLLNPTSS